MTDDVFIQPLTLSDYTGSPPGDSPGFTQLVQDVLGTNASPMDGFDAAVTDAAAIVDALDKVLGEQDAALDAILVTLDTTNPAPLDNSMQGYAGTFGTGASLVTSAQALAPPELLTFPIDPSFGPGIHAPPAQQSVDLGTHHVGDAAFTYRLGDWTLVNERVYRHLGIIIAALSHGDARIFRIVQTTASITRDQNGTTSTGFYDLAITPAIAGAWIAQVSVAGGLYGTGTIVTFTLTLLP